MYSFFTKLVMAYVSLLAYLLAGLLEQTVIVATAPNHERQEVVHVAEVLTVGDALRFVNDQTFEGVDDLLDELPADGGGFAHASVAIEHLVELLVLLDESHY